MRKIFRSDQTVEDGAKHYAKEPTRYAVFIYTEEPNRYAEKPDCYAVTLVRRFFQPGNV